MRRIALFMLAFVVALGMSAGVGHLTAKPVHAVGGACYVFDTDGVVYPDGYFGPPDFPMQTIYDTNSGRYLHIGFDLQAYRLAYGSKCYRSYYASAWVNERVNADSVTAHLRVWICGNPIADFQQDGTNAWGRAVVAYHSNVVWGHWPDGYDWVDALVNTPDGNQWILEFSNYTPCGRQADNQISQVRSAFWVPDTAFVYVNVNG